MKSNNRPTTAGAFLFFGMTVLPFILIHSVLSLNSQVEKMVVVAEYLRIAPEGGIYGRCAAELILAAKDAPGDDFNPAAFARDVAAMVCPTRPLPPIEKLR